MGENGYRHVGVTLEQAVLLIEEQLHYDRESHAEVVPLIEALDRVIAQDGISPISQPPFDRSPLDGYAVRAEDTKGASREYPVALRVIEEVTAGDAPQKTVEQGQAVRIMTGAPIPDGADCVIKQEETDYGEDFVQIYQEKKVHENYCFAGEDFKEGDCLVQKGTRLSYIELGILASMGYTEVSVYRKPRVAVFTTGDELVKPGEALKPGKIYNSNLYVLAARLKELGAETVVADILPDTEEGVAAALKEIAPKVDLILTTGGVSVGKKDILHGAFDLLGADKIFWKVLIKPGTPTIFATVEHTPVLALSGNPFGALTHLELLARPVLYQMTGSDRIALVRKEAVLQDAFPKGSRIRRFVRGIYQDGKVRLPKGLHSSGVLGSMQGCNCLIDLMPSEGAIPVGEIVQVVLLQNVG